MMGRKKEIEEMANILWHIPNNYFLNSYNDCERIAECIYDDGGYRKQSEPISCSHEKDGEWISVDERLPEQCVPVLVYKNSNSEVYGNMETAYFGKGRWRGCCGEFITHWMSLPKAPKMKGDKQE